VDHGYRRIIYSTIFCLPLLAACSGGNRQIVQAPPPTIENSTPTSVDQNQSVSQDEAALDPLAEVLTSVRVLRESGEALRRSGNIDGAQLNFEDALELLWDYSRVYGSDNFEIEREIDYTLVLLQTLKAVEETERAAIDALAGLETSTEDIDPSLREQAESEAEASDAGLPIQIHDRVLSFLEYYTEGNGRRTMELGLERAGQYGPMIRRILQEEGVPEDLIHLAQTESAFKPRALSRAAAKGMWQFIASRGAEYGLRQTGWIDERSDPEKSTRAAARHLRDLHERFGDWNLAMAAYNSGPGRVQRAIDQAGVADFWVLAERNLLPRETRNYVPTILAMTLIGRNPSRYGFDVRPADALEVERVRVAQATDLRVIAEGLELPLGTIEELNPHVLRWATPPDDDEFELILPTGYAGLYDEKIAPLAEKDRLLFQYHIVSRGETLSHLSQRYGVSISAISDTNRLNNQHMVHIGQSLIIPLSGIPVPETSVARVSPPAQAPDVYQIRRGDTLWEIAANFGLAVNDIKSWNEMSSNLLIAGDTLRLRTTPEMLRSTQITPDSIASVAADKRVYNVRSGDTLSQIASSHRISVDAIRTWNLERDLSIIRPGDEITIYCTAATVC
jgi:membrane-bound lytic murein transglycosylase D